MANYLIGADQKIPDWLIKTAFLVKMETAVTLGIKSRLGIMGFSISDAIWGLWVFSVTIPTPPSSTVYTQTHNLMK